MGSRVKKVILVLLLNCCISRADWYGLLGCSDLCDEISLGPRCDCEEIQSATKYNKTGKGSMQTSMNGRKLISIINFDVQNTENCQNKNKKEVIFYSQGSGISMKTRTEEGLESTRIVSILLRKQIITGLSFDVKTQTLFISDAAGPLIFGVNTASSRDERSELVKDRITFPADIAFDWTSNNLYFIDSGTGKAEVISVKTLFRTVLIEDLPKPLSLAISPCNGLMFIATVGFGTSVSMYGMDGKNRRILHAVQGFPVSLALHPSNSLLFWSDPHEGTISYVDYFNSSSSRILKRGIDGVMSVAVSKRDVIFTFDKPLALKEVNQLKVPGYEKDVDWRSITFGIKFSGQSECLIANGGCEYLCLTSEFGGSCACPSEMTLDEDDKSCIS